MARRANATKTLLDQLNSLYPNRNKASDGWLGDSAHQARVSDHNALPNGVVTAQDFTHDPANLDCHKLAQWLVDSKDPRIKYIIWNKRIWEGGVWKAYSGSNPHDKHLHLSVSNHQSLYDNANKWNLGGDVSKVDDDEIDEMSWAHFGYGASQAFLNEHRGKESNAFIHFMWNHPVARAYRNQVAEWRKKAETGTDAQAQRKLDEIKRIVG